MEYLYLIVLLAVAFVPSGAIVAYTNRRKKRGCGRGCARCGNREVCHRFEK